MSDDVSEGLERAERMVGIAYQGLQDFENTNGEDRLMGLMNAVSAGRNVTWVLQKNLSDVDGFDEWYERCREVMEEDEVCSKMIDIRNDIVKEGDEGVVNYAYASINAAELQRRMPLWADGLFIGDQFGGSGYTVEGPNGEEKIYRDFPDLNVKTGLYFERLNDLSEGEYDR